MGTGTLNGSGVATLTTTTLAVGGHSVTATYDADTNFTGSASSPLSQIVNQASTTTTITTDNPDPSVVGQAVTINFTVAAVSPGSGTPSGNVTVSDGQGDNCTATAAVGSCSISFPASGTKTLSAIYAGDSNFATSSSANSSHTINAAATTTTITAHTPNLSLVNQPITVNFAVAVNSPGAGTPTGSVTVTDGTSNCTATIAIGTCQLTPTTTGAKTLTASYATDGTFASSTSAGVSHTVGQPPAITSANNATFTVNTAGSFTVTATGFPPPTFTETGALPNGVTLTSAGVISGTPALGTVGTYPITISASNGVGTDAAQNFTLSVSKITPTFAGLTASQSIVFGTASISLSGRLNGFPMMAGTVTITINGAPVSAIALNGNPNNFGPVTFNTSTIPASTTPYTITYAYSDDANSSTASDTSTTLTVNKATTAFSGLASHPITFGTASVTLGGTIAAGGLFPPNGETVNITVNSVTTPATIGASGAFSALIATHAIPASVTPYTVAYSYPGDANFSLASNTATTLTVNKAASTTTLASSLNPSLAGQQVAFTATVTAASGAPSGSVQFQDGGVDLGALVTLINGGGVFTAQLQTSALSAGPHNITAIYGGDTNISGSASNTVAQVVISPATTTQVVSSLNPSTFGDSVMFTPRSQA